MKFFLLCVVLLFSLTRCSLFDSGFKEVAKHTLFNGEVLEEYKLDNGLQVLVLPRHQAAVLTYQVWVQVGSVDEKLDPKLNKTGLAHLFEHMTFRGTKTRKDGDFDRLTSRMGATYQNASTYYHRTNYYESVPSNKLEDLIELEADRFENLVIDKEALEKEKGAVVTEFRRDHLDSPTSMGFAKLAKTIFKKSPYQETIIGTEENIRSFSVEEANYFYKTYYAPNNTAIIVVGDVKSRSLLRLLKKYYGHLKPQEIPQVPIPEEPQQEAERRASIRHKQATSETLMVAYRGANVSDADFVALNLLSAHLSNGMESRMRKLFVDTGIAVSAYGGPDSQQGLFEFVIRLAEGKSAKKALVILDKEIERLRLSPISQKEFERALSQELLDTYRSIGSNSTLGNALGEYLALGGNYMRGFEILEGYKGLTPEDLNKAAQKYLVRKQRSIVTVYPGARE